MGLIKEFKEFAIKGNMLDMAVGIIIGAAFSTVVNSLVNDIIMPPIGQLTGGVDFSDMSYELGGEPVEGEDGETEPAAIKYGSFINNCITFLIVAFAVFMIVKAANTAKKHMLAEPESEESAPPPEDILLLRDIRDALQGPSRRGE